MNSHASSYSNPSLNNSYLVSFPSSSSSSHRNSYGGDYHNGSNSGSSHLSTRGRSSMGGALRSYGGSSSGYLSSGARNSTGSASFASLSSRPNSMVAPQAGRPRMPSADSMPSNVLASHKPASTFSNLVHPAKKAATRTVSKYLYRRSKITRIRSEGYIVEESSKTTYYKYRLGDEDDDDVFA